MSNNVFDYVIDSLNKTLKNGIEYYKDDKEKKERLVDIYNYINNQQEEYVQVEVVPEDDFKTDKNEEVAKEIKGLIKSFVNKQSNISASALNLENKLKKAKKVEVPISDNDEEELQVEKVESTVDDDIESQITDDIPQSLKRETSDLTESEDFNIVKKLVSDEKDYEQYHKDDNNDVSFDTTFDFDDIVTEIKEKTGEPVEVEPLEEEEELVIEKPRKRSILDIFKKN